MTPTPVSQEAIWRIIFAHTGCGESVATSATDAILELLEGFESTIRKQERDQCAKVEWQDIATAPKDGTEVDLWGSGLGGSPARVPDCARLTLSSGPDWYTRGDNGWECLGAIGFKPTHWMPLPEAPAIRKGSEA